MPSTQIHFPVTVGFKARKQVADQSGASLKITNKIGTATGTIFEAILTGSRENISKAKKMIQDAEFRAQEWAYNQKLKKQSREFDEKVEESFAFQKKGKAAKVSAGTKYSTNPFAVLFSEEPEMKKPDVKEIKKVSKKKPSKNEDKKVTFAEMARKGSEIQRKRSFPDDENVSQPKRLKIETMPLTEPKKVTFDAKKSWGEIALEYDESSGESSDEE